MGSFEINSWVDGPPDQVWEHATSHAGITQELAPWVRMTLPAGKSDRELRAVLSGRIPVPNHLGRAWLVFVGVIPFEYDQLRIVRVEPGRSFTERSEMGSIERWQHHRSVEPVSSGGTTVTDRLAWETRWWMPDFLVGAVVRTLFSRRHRRLRAKKWSSVGPQVG